MHFVVRRVESIMMQPPHDNLASFTSVIRDRLDLMRNVCVNGIKYLSDLLLYLLGLKNLT